MAGIARLSWADLNNLAVEAPDTPMHQGVFAIVDAAPLRDGDGRLRIEDVRGHLAARIERLPELRRVLYRPGFLRGRPLWIDDGQFQIENHVRCATLPPPGGEPAALSFAAREMASLMDRSQPLWRLWLLEGYSPDRVGVLIKLHHALADGPAMINILAGVFDLEAVPLEKPTGAAPLVPAFADLDLLRDSWRLKLAAVGTALENLAHPVRSLHAITSTLSAAREAIENGRRAPRTSLNRPIGAARRVGALHLSLSDVKAVGHLHGATVNDVFLTIVVAALRRVLVARGEPVEGKSIHASVAVSLKGADHSMSGNHAGTVIVSLPADIAPACELIAAVAAATARAKTRQLTVVSTGLMVSLARLRVTRLYIRHQHMINVLTTNLHGPPVPLYFAGARIYEPVAMPPIAGNVTVSFAALSYDGELTVSVVADAATWPDIDLLMSAMRDSWAELRAESLPATPMAM